MPVRCICVFRLATDFPFVVASSVRCTTSHLFCKVSRTAKRHHTCSCFRHCSNCSLDGNRPL